MIKVLGIKIIDRIKEAGLTQGILSKHASVITTRLGFHEVTDEVCSREAYMILHLNGDDSETDKLASELKSLGGIELREMNFSSEKEPLNVESRKKQCGNSWTACRKKPAGDCISPESSDFLWLQYTYTSGSK